MPVPYAKEAKNVQNVGSIIGTEVFGLNSPLAYSVEEGVDRLTKLGFPTDEPDYTKQTSIIARELLAQLFLESRNSDPAEIVNALRSVHKQIAPIIEAKGLNLPNFDAMHTILASDEQATQFAEGLINGIATLHKKTRHPLTNPVQDSHALYPSKFSFGQQSILVTPEGIPVNTVPSASDSLHSDSTMQTLSAEALGEIKKYQRLMTANGIGAGVLYLLSTIGLANGISDTLTRGDTGLSVDSAKVAGWAGSLGVQVIETAGLLRLRMLNDKALAEGKPLQDLDGLSKVTFVVDGLMIFAGVGGVGDVVELFSQYESNGVAGTIGKLIAIAFKALLGYLGSRKAEDCAIDALEDWDAIQDIRSGRSNTPQATSRTFPPSIPRAPVAPAPQPVRPSATSIPRPAPKPMTQSTARPESTYHSLGFDGDGKPTK